ncbi:MAG TPA: DsbA family protein [Roseiarcus sp.]|nr:DsbA family protein [Roseiarcus sp.]
MRRRTFLALALAALATSPALAAEINVEEILNDPASPIGGDPKGDVTIVAFLDYNCPFCKKATPGLAKAVKEDGHVRLVYKDWPILAPSSVDGAKLALAAKYQDKYEDAHAALMALKGRSTAAQMRAAVEGAGVDMARLDADLSAHAADIAALIKRNNAEAESLELQGTPVFLIGPFKVAAAIDYDEFKRVVGQARARQKGGAPSAQ